MMRKILSLALMFLMSCIDPINFKHNEQKEHLVVESSFTNEAGLNYVRLIYAQPYAYPYDKSENNAVVFVSGSQGEVYQFANERSGYYYPSSAEATYGIIGHTYTLTIAVNGKTYQSAPVTLKEPVPIDAVHFEIDQQEYAFAGQQEKQEYAGYRVLVDYEDPAGVQNFYRWSFVSQFEVITQPLDHLDNRGRSDPKLCCAHCWVKENEEGFTVTDDRLTDGGKVVNQDVLFIPFERYLQVRHKLKVYQHSLSEDAYNFFRMMEQQKGSTGTVFDPPPAEIKGNMFNVNDKDEQVLGLFNASAVSVKEVVIASHDIDYPVSTFIFADDCLVIPGATIERPVDW